MSRHQNARGLWAAVAAATAVLAAAPAFAAPAEVPTPVSVLGHDPGDDYYLANYEEAVGYFHKLAAAAPDRMRMVTAGRSTHGKVMEYAVISSPRNLARFEEYKALSHRLGAVEGLTDAEAKALAETGRVIVHIDGGMHSSEVADHQLPIALAYRLLSAKGDPQVDAILDNVILVLWPTLNPDGQDMAVDWYRKNLGTPFETSRMPWLYQEYVGHDNNRDGYMLNMIESQVVTRAEQDYAPAIWYSQHQAAPFPARIWMPPFADPISSNISPYMRTWTSKIGLDMMAAFQNEGKPGAIAEARFDNWFPGFLDYTHVFRNTISFFTETAHDSATPKVYKVEDFPKPMRDLKAQVMYPSPWKGGLWRLKDSVDYMMTASMAVLDTAARYRSTLLYNRYQAGRDNIRLYSTEGPFAYVIPADQADLPEAGLLAQKMIDHGLTVHRARTAVSLGGAAYPAGSWVILMDQPFAGLAKELFEPQKYPDAILDGAGKPADLPYDVTGWTLPMQMGVRVDMVAKPVDAAQRAALEPAARIEPAAGGVGGRGPVYVLSHKVNASFQAVNDVLAAGGEAGVAKTALAAAGGPEAGGVVVGGLPADRMAQIARARGVRMLAGDVKPAVTPMARARVGLYRSWMANIDEGWTRWLLEQYGYAPATLRNADLQAGGLGGAYDVIVLPDIGDDDDDGGGGRLMQGNKPGSVPPQYVGGVGDKGLAALKDFVAGGGTLVAFNQTASTLIGLFDLPVTDSLKGLRSDQFFCSGALLQIRLTDASRTATLGLPADPIVMFENGPAFTTKPGFKGAVLATYAADGNPLRSGVLLHPEAIQGKAAAVEVEYGQGRVVLYGFKPQWRGQSHGAYKFVFNTLYKYGR